MSLLSRVLCSAEASVKNRDADRQRTRSRVLLCAAQGDQLLVNYINSERDDEERRQRRKKDEDVFPPRDAFAWKSHATRSIWVPDAGQNATSRRFRVQFISRISLPSFLISCQAFEDLNAPRAAERCPPTLAVGELSRLSRMVLFGFEGLMFGVA